METQDQSTRQEIRVSVGSDIGRAHSLRNTSVRDLRTLARLVSAGTIPSTRLGLNGTTKDGWLELPKKTRDTLKVKGNYLIAGVCKTSHRTTENVEEVGLLIVDQDEGNLSELEIHAKLGPTGAVFFPTVNSSPASRRWRIIVLLKEPLKPDEYTHAVKAWAIDWGCALDSCSFRPAQAQLLPVSFPDYTPEIIVHEGERLDLRAYLGKASTAVAMSPEADALRFYRPPLENITRAQIEEALKSRSASERGEWIKVGCALRHQYQFDEETGFDIWDKWSATCPEKYDPAECRRQWATLKPQTPGRPPVTILSIVPDGRRLDTEGRSAALREKLAKEIVACNDDVALRTILAPRIASTTGMGEYDRSCLMQEIRDWFRNRPHLQAPSLRQIKTWIYPDPLVGAPHKAGVPVVSEHGGDDDTRAFMDRAQDWVFVQNGDEFVHIKTKRSTTITGFNAEFNFLVVSDGKVRTPAHAIALQNRWVKVVSNQIYMPGYDPIFKMNGLNYLNLWRADTSPKPLDDICWTQDDWKAIRSVLRMLGVLFKKRERMLLIHWASWVLNNLGDHANWCPLIQGPQGSGKTMMGEILAAIIGPENVGIIDPHVLSSGFTSWAEKSVLKIVEEIRLPGERGSNYAIINSLKPYITNNMISIHRKGRDPFNAPNTASYIFFTNHEDAIPIEAGDRRHFVVFTKPRTRDDLDRIKEKYPTLWADVKRAYERHGPALRWALENIHLRYKRPREFEPKGWAPHTAEKDTMRAYSLPNDQAAISETLDDWFVGHNKDDGVVVIGLLREEVARRFPSVRLPMDKRLALTMSALGYARWGKYRWHGEVRNVWVKIKTKKGRVDMSKLSGRQIVEILDRTIGGEFGDETEE